MIPIHLDVPTNGSFTMEILGVNDFHLTKFIYLEDLPLSTIQDLRLDTTYSFTSQSSDPSGRFTITFTPRLMIDTVGESCAGNDGQIRLNQPGSTVWASYVVTQGGNTMGSANNFSGMDTIGALSPGNFDLLFSHANGTNFSSSISIAGILDVTADFSPSASMITVGDTVLFTNNSIGASVYLWDFGDGSNTSTLHLNHHFHQGNLQLYSVLGKLLYDEKISGSRWEFEMPVYCRSGLYFLHFENENSQSTTVPFLYSK